MALSSCRDGLSAAGRAPAATAGRAAAVQAEQAQHFDWRHAASPGKAPSNATTSAP